MDKKSTKKIVNITFKIDKILEQREKENKSHSIYWLVDEINKLEEKSVTYPTLFKIVKNQSNSVNIQLLAKICLILEVSLNDIIDFDKMIELPL